MTLNSARLCGRFHFERRQTMTHEPIWIFDLDNTLHNASAGIFPHINRAMTRYIMTHLAVDETQAHALRQDYWHRYGATLKGLVRHHGIRAEHFLTETHALEHLLPLIQAEAQLGAVLKQLPGRKIVLSNGPLHYVHGVLKQLNIHTHFCHVLGIESVQFRPKPHHHPFRQALAVLKVRPERCIMVEDCLKNLKTAKRLGMRTVWLSRETRRPAHVDDRVRNIRALLKLCN